MLESSTRHPAEREGRVIITVAFHALNNEDRIRVFISQDAHEPRTQGNPADLERHEVLQLLSMLGVNQQDSENILGLILRPPAVETRQFDLTAAQEAEVRSFFHPGTW